MGIYREIDFKDMPKIVNISIEVNSVKLIDSSDYYRAHFVIKNAVGN
jgi:hypothetical protein